MPLNGLTKHLLWLGLDTASCTVWFCVLTIPGHCQTQASERGYCSMTVAGAEADLVGQGSPDQNSKCRAMMLAWCSKAHLPRSMPLTLDLAPMAAQLGNIDPVQKRVVHLRVAEQGYGSLQLCWSIWNSMQPASSSPRLELTLFDDSLHRTHLRRFNKLDVRILNLGSRRLDTLLAFALLS